MPRPAVASGRISVNVSNYNGLQHALNQTLPWLIDYQVDYDLGGGSYGNVVMPPYLATWVGRQNDEQVPIQIKNGSINSFTASGGVGVLQLTNVSLTGQNANGAAAESRGTYRLALINCDINTNGGALLANGGHLKCQGVSVNANNYGVKVANWGRFWPSSNGVTGSVSGPAYDVDRGFINFNHQAPTISGSPTVAANDANADGFALDEGNSRLFGPNAIQMQDQATGNTRIVTIQNGSPTISR